VREESQSQLERGLPSRPPGRERLLRQYTAAK
jgi:hypothetical protein